MRLHRRDLFRLGIAVGGAALLPPLRRSARADDLPASPPTRPFAQDLVPGRGIPPIARPVAPFPTKADPADCVNVDGSTAFHVSGPRVVAPNTEFYLMHEREVEHSFHPDLPPSLLWSYGGSIPGPTFVARSGTPHLVRFVNDLPERSSVGIGEPITAVHRHGGFQMPQDDGYPLDTFCTGQSRDYYYPNRPDDNQLQNEHSTNWYHDHAIDTTAQNVYRGLAGFYLYFNALDTGNEQDPPPALGLPSGEYDLGLVIQDRRFDREGFLFYDSFDHDGFLGDKFCVNGLIQPVLRVARRKYRFRLLNGSNARVYQLALSDGRPFTVIGTDTHLFEHPLRVQSFTLAPAERVEVVLDFADLRRGSSIFLVNRLEQKDPRKPGDRVSPGTPLLQLLADRDAPDPSRVPATLIPVTEGPAQLLPRVRVQRRFKFDHGNGAWMINGRFFDENRIDARPRREQPEIWILESGGGWVHPVHIHLSEFWILSRDGKAPPAIERSRKDTVLVGGSFGREVRILIEFEEFTGRYVFHCHNVEHEDMRMMGQFEVLP